MSTPPFPSPSLPNYFISSLAQTLNVGGNDTSIQLGTIYTLDGQIVDTADFATFGRGIVTIDPLTLNAVEFTSFTGLTAGTPPAGTLTGTLRGLSFKDNTQLAANQKFHVVGAPVLIAFGTHNIIDIVDLINTSYNTLFALIESAIIQGAMDASQTVTGITRLIGSPNVDLSTCTISIANPAVITRIAHGLTSGDEVVFATTGTLPAAITAGQKYYVLAVGLTLNTFEISLTFNGTPIDTTGNTQSGVQNVTRVTPYAITQQALDEALTSLTRIGGDGSDGPLLINAGTTTLDLAGAVTFEKNYSSFEISGTGQLAFINPAAGGTTIVLKSQTDVIITSSAGRPIDLRNLGSTAGVGGASVTQVGAGGLDGHDGTNATDGTITYGPYILNGGPNGTKGGLGHKGLQTVSNAAGGVTTSPVLIYAKTTTNLIRSALTVLFLGNDGAGGGGGGSGGLITAGNGHSGAGGTGGIGAGSLIIECGGAFTFTTFIDASGTIGSGGGAGSPGGAGDNIGGGGGGGGGSGGIVIILCSTIATNTGAISVLGGAGGIGGAGSINLGPIIGAGDGGGGGSGGSNIFNAGGIGGVGGYDTSSPATNGIAGSGLTGGAGGIAGVSAGPTISAHAGGGGGGGGGASGLSVITTI